MIPMKIPPLPSESIYWEAFNESECLSIIMRAQNYITDELIRRSNPLLMLMHRNAGCFNFIGAAVDVITSKQTETTTWQ